MTDRELMKLALDALLELKQCVIHEYGPLLPKEEAAIEALRARLAQPEPVSKTYQLPEPEPVAWINNRQTGNFFNVAPPQREWQGLTDEECHELREQYLKSETAYGLASYSRMVEAKLKEKNT